MEPARLIWSKLKWGLLLVLAVLVAVFGILQVTHQPASIRSATQRTTAPLAGLTPATCKLLPPETPPEFATVEFKTDFRKHCVHYDEILSGGPPKDGIPALDAPRLVTVNEANAWLKPDEPVIYFQVGSDARAYPMQILIWHEIVNDTVGGVPVAVTFCPLCNTAIVFQRTVRRRVLMVVLGGEAVAYPFDALKKVHVVNDTAAKTGIVVLWTAGTSSPLDTDTVAGGRDVGAATVYLRTLDGQPLTFKFAGTNIVDKETGSVWDILRQPPSAQLAWQTLTPVVAVNSFCFA